MLGSLFIQIKSCLVDGAHCTVFVAILAFTRGVIASSIPVANEKWLKGCFAGCFLHLDVRVRLDWKVSDFVCEFRRNVQGFRSLHIIIGRNERKQCETTYCHIEKSAQTIDNDKVVLPSKKLSDSAWLLCWVYWLIKLNICLNFQLSIFFGIAVDSVSSECPFVATIVF